MRRDHVLQFVLEAAQTPDFQGVTAQAVADALSIWRNDAAVELNKLVAEGKLRRVGKKNVRFFPASEETADIRPEPAVQEEPPQAEEETGQYRAFSGLVGADGSLKYQLRVAMAAVAYPPNGLNMLITGSTGSGKSHFARTIWEYAKETKALCGAHAPIPFVEFNCAEYADNPQLLLSHLFGYKKGAFTGALEDKPGLVEQANGGILFLDEIHGLSSTGQEMFFSLLDTGVFRRVGDNTPRTSRFMLIGATTKPLTDLLETFLRRMPVLISMPTLSDRPMKERLELVEHFYAEEATHIGRTLRIQKGALNSILDYSLHSNLGVLKNLVQLSCAKAFLRENVAGNRTGEIAVTFSDLSFQTYNVSAETEKYAHGDLHFAEDLVVPNQRIQSSAADVASFVDVYDFVESRLSGEQEQHHDAGNLQQIIAAEIDNYYVDMERALQAPDVDRSLLDSVLFPGSIGICSEFLSRASYALNHVYPSIAATLLAMHLSQYVSRMRSEQPAFPLSVRGGLQGYGAELDVHLLKDGHLAVIHDASLKRTAGADVLVEDLTSEELKAYRLEGTDERIPLLDEVLALFEGKTPLVVELKPERGNHAELAAATCALLDRYRVDYCIESFDPRCLIWLRKNRPEIIRGQLSSQFLRHGETVGHGKLTMWLLGNLMTNIAVQPDFIAYRFQDRKNPALAWCRKFYKVQEIDWTIRTKEEMQAAEQKGNLVIFECFDPRA